MILSRTPLRLSICGGGTDMKSFYSVHGGCVISFAINKYVYIGVNEKFDGRTRVSYSQTENVDDPKDLKHDIARECLRFMALDGLEIVSISDIPGGGTGLGSSSSYAVGLLAALTSLTRKGPTAGPGLLAMNAYHVERDRCGHPVGKQDHLPAAYGGLHAFTFRQDDTIGVNPILLDKGKKEYLESHFMLFYTGVTRDAGEILQHQEYNLRHNANITEVGIQTRDLAMALWGELGRDHFNVIGNYLSESWELKQRFTDKISSPEVTEAYKRAMNAGASGGKLCGAGGGGFLLFWVNPSKQEKVKNAIGLRQVSFGIEDCGSKVIYYGGKDGKKEDTSIC